MARSRRHRWRRSTAPGASGSRPSGRTRSVEGRLRRICASAAQAAGESSAGFLGTVTGDVVESGVRAREIELDARGCGGVRRGAAGREWTARRATAADHQSRSHHGDPVSHRLARSTTPLRLLLRRPSSTSWAIGRRDWRQWTSLSPRWPTGNRRRCPRGSGPVASRTRSCRAAQPTRCRASRTQ